MWLVTGATGHIGNVLARELGYHPRRLYESIADAVHWFLEKKTLQLSEVKID